MKIIVVAFPIACFDMVMIKGGSWQRNLDRNRDEMGQSRVREWRTHASDPLSPCIHLFLSIVTRDALSLSMRYRRLTDRNKNSHHLFCFFFLSSLPTDRIWILCWSAKAHERKTRPTKIYWRDVLNTAPFSSRNRITLVADYVRHRSWVSALWIL